MCTWVVMSECRISDSDHARAVMISAARSRSPRPASSRRGAAVPAHVWALTMTGQEYWK